MHSLDCLFQLCPKFAYSAQEKMLEKLKSYKLTPQTWNPNLETSHLSKEAQSELLLLAKEEKDERENNEMVINKSVGRTIDFGDIVQLKHVRSGMFLTVMRERARQEPTAMSIQAIPFGNVLSQFVVVPGFKTSKLGEKVTYGVAVQFESAKQLGVFMHATDAVDSSQEELITSIHEVNGSAEGGRFKMVPYHSKAKSKASSKQVHGGSIVTLYHRESASLMTSERGSKPQFKLMDSQADGESSNLISSALWIIEASHPQWAGDPINVS